MASIAKPLALLAILLAALPAQAQNRAAPSAASFYCCNGGRICGDSLPEQCRGKAYRIYDSKGNFLRDVGPPMSADEKAALLLEERQRKEAEDKLKEQRRKDQALLDTYATAEDIDLAQRKAEADVNLAIKGTEEKIESVKKRRKKFEDEAEFYKNKAMPPEVAKGLGEANHEIMTLQELIAVKKNDLANIKAKYDADRKRYLELTGGKSAPAAKTAPPTR